MQVIEKVKVVPEAYNGAGMDGYGRRDVYVAINAQYHDYCELFEKWFGKGNFDDMIFESAISFWFDDVDFGEDKLWKYFNELK